MCWACEPGDLCPEEVGWTDEEQLPLFDDEEWAALMNHFNKLEGSDLNEVPEV